MKSYFAPPNSFLAIILQLPTQFNSSAPKFISRQVGYSTLHFMLLFSTFLYCRTLLITTLQGPRRKNSLYCWIGVFTAPLPSNRYPIVAPIGSRGNVFTESLPSNGYTSHNIILQFARSSKWPFSKGFSNSTLCAFLVSLSWLNA
jgi:hypothetical protein